jgi:hypothetical protein
MQLRAEISPSKLSYATIDAMKRAGQK